MAYPNTYDSFDTSMQGTSLVSSPDHAFAHRQLGSAVGTIENTLGTNSGTAVLKNFLSGDFAVRINSSNVLQQPIQGTINSSTLGTPTIGNFSNSQHTHQDTAGGGQLVATSVFASGTIPTARLGSGTANSTKFLRGDQSWSAPSAILDRSVSTTNVTNTTVETSLYSFTIPGNTLGTAGNVKLYMRGSALNNSGGNAAVTFRLKYGTTTISSIVETLNDSSTNVFGFLCDSFLLSNGTTNIQKASLFASMSANSAGNGRQWQGYGTAVEDSTGDLSLNITVELGTASSNLRITKEFALLESI